MTEQENNPEILVSVPGDLEASMIISALAAEGVDATATGSYTSGFLAEAPGEVQVLVRKRDLLKAKQLLGDLMPNRQMPLPDSSAVAIAHQRRFSPGVAWLLVVLVMVALILRFLATFSLS